ncbi:hypothetical protein CMI37_17230 [Candidatus Pacearchaeota archaeon]|nr:hypothetical protein [Candidatus Pacearchaeota archaeon]|tara:strand:- start:1184 stop:1363 length:180 start_codon:yes stop_codon:yes gene_type:complete
MNCPKQILIEMARLNLLLRDEAASDQARAAIEDQRKMILKLHVVFNRDLKIKECEVKDY